MLEQTHSLDEYLQVAAGGTSSLKCLKPSAASKSLVESDRDTLEQEFGASFVDNMGLNGNYATNELSLGACTTEDNVTTAVDAADTFIFLKSSGQLQHKKSGKCLTALVGINTGDHTVALKTCTMVENQHKLQRFEAPAYTAGKDPDQRGPIRLGYAGHTLNAMCLTHANGNVDIGDCKDAGYPNWVLEKVGNHRWKKCSAVDEKCQCAGEIRFGDVESQTYSAGLPTFKKTGTTMCSAEGLQMIALGDPAGSATDPTKMSCECRHDSFMDGDETVLDDATTLGVDVEKLDDVNGGSLSTTTIIIIIAAGVVAVVAIFGVCRVMGRGSYDLGGEYEEEWGEEWEEWEEENWEEEY
jgi:hypothetical protein